MVELKHKFPESFFEEEERLGFHIDRKRKEIWAVELDMLYELDRVCKELNIRYFLDGGTLLGAARDGKFIPWDDDIDVSMLREDYDRFVREAPGKFAEPLFLQTGYTEKDYFRGHAQLRNSETAAILPHEFGRAQYNQGIFLDIFVLDEVFLDKVKKQYQKREALFRQRYRWNHHDYHPNPLRWGARWIRYLLYHMRFPDQASFYACLERLFRSEEKSRYVDYLMLNSGTDQVHSLNRAWYEDTVLLRFEDHAFPAPAGYQDYLALYYGADWKTPKKKPSMHGAGGQVLFDTGRSYTEVLNAVQ